NQLSYEPQERLATGRIVWFVRETELWWRGEETHTQRAWSDDEIAGALAQAGLKLVERYDPAKHANEPRRLIYVASKP
ncbi:MAG TPA: class I SAM-dependent methyltransferase, partial [Roseiflexaceae bacterium]|nr:class I SAM-dependent methyltransferase [Roseiflexaceae bacterium]